MSLDLTRYQEEGRQVLRDVLADEDIAAARAEFARLETSARRPGTGPSSTRAAGSAGSASCGDCCGTSRTWWSPMLQRAGLARAFSTVAAAGVSG